MVCKVLMSRVHLYFFVKTENLILLPPRNKHLNQALHKLLENTVIPNNARILYYNVLEKVSISYLFQVFISMI